MFRHQTINNTLGSLVPRPHGNEVTDLAFIGGVCKYMFVGVAL